jgi:hypothetical protein
MISMNDPRVPDGVVSIAARRDAHTWEWCGEVEARADGVTLPAFLDVVGPTEGGLRARLLGAEEVLSALATHHTLGLVPNAASSASWSVNDAEVVSEILFDVAAHLKLLIPDQCVPAGLPSRPRLHRMVYLPLALPMHRFQTWRGHDGGTHAQFFNAFTLFERIFAITQIRDEDREADRPPVLSLAWEGEDLTDSEFDALEMALFLMGGRGARRATIEHYDANGLFDSRTFDYGTFALSTYARRIFPLERFWTDSSQAWIPALVERLHAAFAAGTPMRPILFHFFSSQIHNSELAMLFLGTTREAMLPQPGNRETTLFSIEEFRERAAPAVAIVRERFKDLGEDELRTLLARFEGLNDVSVSRRRKMLAASTAVVPDENEVRVLRHRDDVAHAGYILDTSYDEERRVAEGDPALAPYADRLRELKVDEKVFRHFVTRTLLRVIGYAGPYVDARDGTVAQMDPPPAAD